MICCKCKKPIERSYGRVTDLGNYCRECAMQNEIEATKVNNQFVADINKKLNRLAELEDKLENGTLVELHCKAGDKVYQFDNGGKIYESEIKSIYYAGNTLFYDCGYFAFDKRAIGKTVFLTKAEAEAKLKELKGE